LLGERSKYIPATWNLSTSYKDVVLEKVLGSIMVKGKHGDIEIKNENPPTKSINV
jgi:hypothetical protein